MITHRLRGLINLHLVATTFVAGAFFLLAVSATRYQPWVQLSPDLDLVRYLIAVIAGTVASGRFFANFGNRFHRLSKADALALTARQVSVITLMVFTLVVATKDQTVSRLFLASYLVLLSLVLLVTNLTLPRALAKLAFSGNHFLPTLFVGHSRARNRLEHWLKQKEHLGIRPVGFISDDSAAVAHEATGEGTDYLGTVSDLARVIEERNVGQVILLDLPTQSGATDRILEVCQAAGCRLLIHNTIEDHIGVPLVPLAEDGHHFFTTLEEPLEDPLNRAMKRVFDIAVSLPVVVFILPILSIVVLLVQLWQAPGPLLFLRTRGGVRGSEFFMRKYRSMYAAAANPLAEAKQASAGDNRIYPFGRFLRHTSLDEFPQFINVLLGDMSIVGPRPHLAQHDKEFSRIAKTYRSRQLVKPGITGLAQVGGYRGEITDPSFLLKRVELDIYYITHWSIWLDMTVTLKTIRHVCFPLKSAV